MPYFSLFTPADTYMFISLLCLFLMHVCVCSLMCLSDTHVCVVYSTSISLSAFFVKKWLTFVMALILYIFTLGMNIVNNILIGIFAHQEISK